jgi:hypothetical protein
MSLMDSTQESAEALASRLEELGVHTAPDQVEELVAAYPALLAWMRTVQVLADEPMTPAAET